MSAPRSESELLIVFANLSRFSSQSLHESDATIADVLDTYYEKVAEATERAGGTLVKFIGDGILMVFPEPAVDAGVDMLLALKNSMDRLFMEHGWECRFAAKVHFGTAIAGFFGAAGAKRYDVD